jgi:hypothetical protein
LEKTVGKKIVEGYTVSPVFVVRSKNCASNPNAAKSVAMEEVQ